MDEKGEEGVLKDIYGFNKWLLICIELIIWCSAVLFLSQQSKLKTVVSKIFIKTSWVKKITFILISNDIIIYSYLNDFL